LKATEKITNLIITNIKSVAYS